MDINERDFKKDVRIDVNNLEEEWIEHPSVFLYYSDALSDAIYDKDTKKSFVELTQSRLYDRVKSDWKPYFSQKPSEAAIKEWIKRQPEYRNAEKRFLLAQKDVNLLANVKTALEHKKVALSNITSLKISGFHSEPRNKKRDVDNLRNAQKQHLNKKRRTQRRVVL